MARSFLSNCCVSRKGIGLLSASVNSQMVNKSSFGSWRSRLRWRLLRPVVTASSTMLPEDVIVIWSLSPARGTTVEHVLTCYILGHVSCGKGGVSVAQRGLEIVPDGKWGSHSSMFTLPSGRSPPKTRERARGYAHGLFTVNNISYCIKHHATGYAVYTILHIFRPAFY